jgi:hypothetical protein
MVPILLFDDDDDDRVEFLVLRLEKTNGSVGFSLGIIVGLCTGTGCNDGDCVILFNKLY